MGESSSSDLPSSPCHVDKLRVETAVQRTTRFLFAALAAGLTACGGVGRGAESTGAPTPALAVERFLGSARAQDLQAMSAVWGTAKGPARDVVDRSQLEQRELIMMCYLTHDSYQVLSEGPAVGGKRSFAVQLRRGDLSRATTIVAVPGPSNRWYVEQVALEPLRDLCQGTNPPPGTTRP